jgi:hypothetical protein
VFDFLIRALGGFTEREVSDREAGWRARALAAEATVELFKDIVKRERDRSDKIENDIRERMYPRHQEQQQPPNMKPIGNTISSWPRIKRELERQNRAPNETPSKSEVENSM